MLCVSTALEYEDFRPVEIDLIFNEETSNKHVVSVPILNDRCLEYREDFSVVVSSEMDCVAIHDNATTIYIIDDDSKFT